MDKFISPKTFIHPHPLKNEGFPNPILTRTMVPAEGEGASCCQKIKFGQYIGLKLPSPSRFAPLKRGQGEGAGKALAPQRVRVNTGSCGKTARELLPNFEPSHKLPKKGKNGVLQASTLYPPAPSSLRREEGEQKSAVFGQYIA
jgi:hypothetical protein